MAETYWQDQAAKDPNDRHLASQANLERQRNAERDAFRYGGDEGEAQRQYNNYQTRGTNIERRDPSQYYADARNSRSYQADVYNRYSAQANGTAPSAAQMAGDWAADRAAATQSSIAASARGPAALAMAGQNAAQQTAMAQQNIAQQTMLGRMQEQEQARAGMAQAANAMRQGDLAYGQGVSNALAQNDAASLAQRQMAENVRARDDAGRAAGQEYFEDKRRWNSTDQKDTDDRNRARKREHYQAIGGVVSALGQTAAGAAMLSDVTAKQDMAPLGAMGGMKPPTTEQKMGTGISSLFSGVGGGLTAFGMLSDETTKQGMRDLGAVQRQADAQIAALGSYPGLAALRGGGPEKAPSSIAEGIDPSVARTLAALNQPAAARAKADAPAMEPYLQSIRGAMYDYKPESGGPPGTQVGPASAQAIASTPVGSTVVEKAPSGKLAINAQKALKTGMAADAYLNDKLNAIVAGLGLDGPTTIEQLLAARRKGG